MQKYVAVPSKGAWSYDATVKPRKDIGIFAGALGYSSIDFPMFGQEESKLGSVLSRVIPRSLVVLQFPTYNSNTTDLKLLEGLKHKNCLIVLWIHDIDSLRGLTGSLNEDTKWFSYADLLVVISEDTKEYLLEHCQGLNSGQIVVQQAFDYYVPRNDNFNKLDIPEKTSQVVYAGNLTKNKAAFLSDIRVTDIDIFGRPDKDIQKVLDTYSNLHYKGAVLPQDIPYYLQGYSWGLVWDGVEGSKYQDYLKYNWSHKGSLYLSSGVPIIAAKGTHTSNLVGSLKVGVSIERLEELSSLEKYSVSSSNKLTWESRIKHGWFTGRVLKDIESRLIW